MGIEDTTSATPLATLAQPPEPVIPPPTRLARLRDREQPWRQKTIATLLPLLPPATAAKLRKTAELADESWQDLAAIDLDTLTDADFRPARIYVGLGFVGFGALMLTLLMLYYHSLRPDLILADQIRQYWYPYIFFVCFGVAGMFMLGREAMRPPFVGEDASIDDASTDRPHTDAPTTPIEFPDPLGDRE